uniref:Reverse transcriptase domain-containing protein n=1 Tax=Tanacetum cinerariifolium TaxID=118510 RepID=A0A6L2JEI0_TANCI|nr:reverse transcriptase domain-containing protein [Tanacetum cinerariifolium]
MAPKRATVASKEVEELRKARILKDTRYQTWVANTVMVKKMDKSWRMCVDFTDINKACPKDCYSLPKIDWKVDSYSDFKLKCFLNLYKDFLEKTKEEDEETNFKQKQQTEQTTKWKLYKDGASSGDGSGAGLIIVSPEGMEFTYALTFEFTTTNNKAEYEVVIVELYIAREMKIEEVTVFVDSQLVANQVNGSYEAKYDHTKQYLQITKDMAKKVIREIHEGAFGLYTGPRTPASPMAHKTSPETRNEESPFSLTYGVEAVLPIEISIPTKRTRKVDPTQNDKDLRINLEVLEERREIAAIREAAYKKKIEQYYNKKVRPSKYKPKDYVL